MEHPFRSGHRPVIPAGLPGADPSNRRETAGGTRGRNGTGTNPARMTNHLSSITRRGPARRAAIVAAICLSLPTAHAGLEAFMRLGSLGGGQAPIGSGITDASVPTRDGWFPIRLQSRGSGPIPNLVKINIARLVRILR